MFVLGLLLFFLFFFDVDFRGDESGLVATAAAGVGGSMMGPPPSPPGLGDADATAVDAEEQDEAEEAAALSRAHSSLWPVRHAARWQASLQYFRCRQPEQKCSGPSLVPQNAHASVIRSDQIGISLPSPPAPPRVVWVIRHGTRSVQRMTGRGSAARLLKTIFQIVLHNQSISLSVLN